MSYDHEGVRFHLCLLLTHFQNKLSPYTLHTVGADEMKLWDMETGEEEKSFAQPGGAVIVAGFMTALTWCLDDTMVVTAGMGSFLMLDPAGGEELTYTEQIPHQDGNNRGKAVVNISVYLTQAKLNTVIFQMTKRSQ